MMELSEMAKVTVLIKDIYPTNLDFGFDDEISLLL